MNVRLAVFLSLLVLSPAVAVPPPVADIDALVKKHDINDDTPGIGILIIQNGKTHFEKGYGLARLRDKTPLTPIATFELASVSKTFTGTAVLILHDRGLLSFSDDIRKHLPEMPQYGRPIHIRDLLHHTSGLPDYMRFENVKTTDPRFASNADYVPLFAARREKFPLTFTAGEKYEYNNTNYMLLAAIIERISKKSYGTFLHDEIFKPLKMNDSWVYEKPGLTPKHRQLGYLNAISYGKKGKDGFKEDWSSPPFRDEHLLTTGDGGIWTSLHDMAKWDAGIRSGKLVKPATWQEAMKPSKTRDGKTNDYGYGWALYRDKGGKLTAFGHDGSWGGFRTSYYRDVLRDRTIVLLSNSGGMPIHKFWDALVPILDNK